MHPSFTPVGIRRHVSLAPYTTLGLGGQAEYFYEAQDESSLLQVLSWADTLGLPIRVLGGGSNLVISDAGVPGLVVAIRLPGIHWDQKSTNELILSVGAGEPWDDIVRQSVLRDAAGLECLSGIPGLAGSTPVQNVGAYGQDIAGSLFLVRAFDRVEKKIHIFDKTACQFQYRDSFFKHHPQRFVILSVSFLLNPNGIPSLHYPELKKQCLPFGNSPTLQQVRDAVLAIRRSKSMVWEKTDDNHRSVGSFFINPIVSQQNASALIQRMIAAGLAATPTDIPTYPLPDQQIKFSAAWLIEKSGLGKGTRFGSFGISTKHSLCLVHHGGGKTTELIQFAEHIQKTVFAICGVHLTPEPEFWGIETGQQGSSPLF